jgi:protein-S-isoprenylcysteine O-methyltransferase Ste14
MGAAIIVLRILTVGIPFVLGLAGRLYRARARPGSGPARPTHQGNPVPTALTYGSVLLALVVLCLPLAAFPGMGDPALLLLAGIGLVMMVVGCAIMLWARVTLGAAWSKVPQAGAVPAPVTTGPYARVRHPVYLGYLLALVGLAVAFAHGAALVVLLVGTLPLLLWRAREEERLLTAVYGEEYRLYRRRTKMVIPYLI